MKKNMVSIIVSLALFFISNLGYAMNIAVLSPVWSSAVGGPASFTLIVVTVPYSTGGCNYIFQDTTTPVSAFGGAAVTADQFGVFTVSVSNPTACNATLNAFTLLVNCSVIYNGFPDYAGTHTATITGTCL